MLHGGIVFDVSVIMLNSCRYVELITVLVMYI